MNKENEELKTKCSDLGSDNHKLVSVVAYFSWVHDVVHYEYLLLLQSSSLKSETQAKRAKESELLEKLEEKTKAGIRHGFPIDLSNPDIYAKDRVIYREGIEEGGVATPRTFVEVNIFGKSLVNMAICREP